MIADDLAGVGGDGPGAVVQLIQGLLVRLGRFAGHGIALRVGHALGPAGCENIVERVVGVVADGEVVIAGVEDIGARFAGIGAVDGLAVIGGEDVIGKAERHGLTLAAGKGGGLSEVRKLDGALLGLPGFPGQLDVELHHVLALSVEAAVVGDLDLGGHGVARSVPVDAQKLLGEVGIALPRAEGVDHFVRVVPAAVFGSIDALGAVGVVDAEHRVLIARLIVLVAYIDALGIDEILVLVEAGEIRKGKVAGILHGGGAERIRGIGDHVSAGGVGLAGQKIRNAGKAVVAGIADPQNRVHAVVG